MACRVWAAVSASAVSDSADCRGGRIQGRKEKGPGKSSLCLSLRRLSQVCAKADTRCRRAEPGRVAGGAAARPRGLGARGRMAAAARRRRGRGRGAAVPAVGVHGLHHGLLAARGRRCAAGARCRDSGSLSAQPGSHRLRPSLQSTLPGRMRCSESPHAGQGCMAWGTAGVWMCEESLGSAGTSGLGFSGGCWAPDGAGVLAHGFTGALHLWRRAGAGWPWRSARPYSTYKSPGEEGPVAVRATAQMPRALAACRAFRRPVTPKHCDCCLLARRLGQRRVCQTQWSATMLRSQTILWRLDPQHRMCQAHWTRPAKAVGTCCAAGLASVRALSASTQA